MQSRQFSLVRLFVKLQTQISSGLRKPESLSGLICIEITKILLEKTSSGGFIAELTPQTDLILKFHPSLVFARKQLLNKRLDAGVTSLVVLIGRFGRIGQ